MMAHSRRVAGSVSDLDLKRLHAYDGSPPCPRSKWLGCARHCTTRPPESVRAAGGEEQVVARVVLGALTVLGAVGYQAPVRAAVAGLQEHALLLRGDVVVAILGPREHPRRVTAETALGDDLERLATIGGAKHILSERRSNRPRERCAAE